MFMYRRGESDDDEKDSFWEGQEQVFEHYPKQRMKVLLGDLNVHLEIEDILKSKIWEWQTKVG